MSSLQTHIAQPKKNPTKIFTPNTPCYDDSVFNSTIPIPFYVTKQGVLEINIQDNVQANLLTVGTFAQINNQPDFQCKVMGGLKPVVSIGQTVKDFLTAWINYDEGQSPTGDFELVVKPVMTKLQFSTNPGQFEDEDTYSLSDYAPSSDDYITGAEENKYRTVWAFQSPMTVKYYSEQNSKYRYASLVSAFDSI